MAQAGARLLSPAFDPRTTALVPAAQACGRPRRGAGTDGDAGASVVAVRRYDAHRIEMDVDAPAGGLLVSSEAAYPGWRSRVDGRDAETLLVNTAFRGSPSPRAGIVSRWNTSPGRSRRASP